MQLKQLCITACFLLAAIFSSAQTPKKSETSSLSTTISNEDIHYSPFYSKGINELLLQRNFQFEETKPKDGSGHSTTTQINLAYDRFILDHIGIGLGFNSSSSSDHYGTAFKTSDWMLSGNIMYGTTVGNNFNITLKASAGFGKDKSVYNSNTTTYNVTGFNFQVGFPIHLFEDGGNYISPFLGYNITQEKLGGAKTTDNKFQFGFSFLNFSPCKAYSCDLDRRLSGGAYNKGKNFIDYTSWGSFDFGNSKDTYNGNSSKSDVSGGMLDFTYGHYLFNNFALGAEFEWNNQTIKSGDVKNTNSEILFTPMLRINAPSTTALNNLFVQGGYGFGQERFKSGSNEQKSNESNYCINLGYNLFFSKHLAVTPKLEYESETLKNTTTDQKNKVSGFSVGFGTNLNF